MADGSLNQVVLDAFRQANGNAGAAGPDLQALAQELLPKSGDGFSTALADVSRQIDALRSANQALAEVVQNNTAAVNQNSAAQSSGGKSVAGTIGSVASTVLGSGLGLVPLVTSIARLFGGGKTEAAPSLIPFTPPAALRLDVANASQPFTGVNGFAPLNYGQDGLPRVAPETQQRGAATQISIQVNALDSRSFLDHSNEIADAVRQAMLNSHALNDVVSDL